MWRAFSVKILPPRENRFTFLYCYTDVLGPREVNCEVCLCQHFKILLNTKQLEVIELRGNGLEF